MDAARAGPWRVRRTTRSPLSPRPRPLTSHTSSTTAASYGRLRTVYELAITVVGKDRPGIIADVSAALSRLGLNLTDSTMTLLRGHFAMTLICAGQAGEE